MAPIPKRELMAKMRKKRKESEDKSKWDESLMKDRERKKVAYHCKKNNLTEEEKKLNREKTRLKVQKHRMKKKLENQTPLSKVPVTKKSYKTPQSLGKAVKKLMGSLPKSPGKQKEVIKAVVKKSLHLKETCKELFTSKNTIRKDDKVTKEVIEFFQNDDISRQAPGKRDVRSIKDEITGKRIKIPIRHMLMNITDAYYEFKKRSPETKVSLSKFFACRPKFVLLASQTPHNVCICKKHLNFNFLIKAVHCEVNEFPTNHNDLLGSMCCDQSKEKCMFNSCRKCKYDAKVLLASGVNLGLLIKFKKWEEVDGFLQVNEKVVSLKDAVEEINKQLPSFKEHTYVKRAQHEYFESCKSREDVHQAVVQVDFAENATLTAQNQIQSAHWKQKQVTVFTCVIWSSGRVKSAAIISDELSHSKYAVWTFLKVIGNLIKEEFPMVSNLVIFSDNAASQFRSKFTVSNLCYLEEDMGFWNIEWVTFAASHGKGAVDGVGAVIKNQIWNKVKSKNLSINTAEEYYQEVVKTCNIKAYYVPKEDIKSNEILLDQRWESLVKEISVKVASEMNNSKEKSKLGLQSFHFFERFDGTSISAGRTATSELRRITVLNETEESDDDNNRLRYSDVYSESENEMGFLESPTPDQREEQPVPGQSCRLKPYELSALNIHPDTYVLVELKSEITKHVSKYVGVCQSDVCEEEGEVLVMFMKVYGNDQKVFVMNEKDTKFINFEQIVKILKPPRIKNVGNRILYVFDRRIDVNEM